MHKSLISLFILLVVAPAAFAAAPPQLQVAVSKQAVTVSNVTRGGSIVLFSCSRGGMARTIAVKPGANVLRDDDKDGVIQFAPIGGLVMLRSVWIAVDQESGAVAAGARPEFPLIVRPLAEDNLRKDVEQQIASLAIDIPRLLVLLVRPGTGAWIEAVFDGEKGDHGASNGRVDLSFEDLQTIDGKDKAPKHLKKDDAVIAIDPGQLDVFVAQVGK
jgi:hypothetical protein